MVFGLEVQRSATDLRIPAANPPAPPPPPPPPPPVNWQTKGNSIIEIDWRTSHLQQNTITELWFSYGHFFGVSNEAVIIQSQLLDSFFSPPTLSHYLFETSCLFFCEESDIVWPVLSNGGLSRFWSPARSWYSTYSSAFEGDHASNDKSGGLDVLYCIVLYW